MPSFPSVSSTVATAPVSVYSTLADRAAASGREVVSMHIGDTWLEAPEGCRMEDLRVAEIAGLHRYAPVQGLPALLSAVARRVERAQGVETRPNDVLVTAGATGGFGAVLGAVCAPGDEVNSSLTSPFDPQFVRPRRSLVALASVPSTRSRSAARCSERRAW